MLAGVPAGRYSREDKHQQTGLIKKGLTPKDSPDKGCTSPLTVCCHSGGTQSLRTFNPCLCAAMTSLDWNKWDCFPRLWGSTRHEVSWKIKEKPGYPVTLSHIAESHSTLHFQNLKNLRCSLGSICLDFKHRAENYHQARQKAMGFWMGATG